MKKLSLLLLGVFVIYSCGNKSSDSKNSSTIDSTPSHTSTESKTSENAIDNPFKVATNSELNDLFNMGKGMLEASEKNGDADFQLDTETILDMLEESGVSRESMEKLINNPDSLKVLAQQAMKARQEAKEDMPVIKEKITKEQLASKKTPTGVSLEEAILIVQTESGPEATMAKLKTIDSLAGTNMMSQLDLTEAGYVMGDVERKNEISASAEEEQKMKELQDKSRQMHSEKESGELLAELEATEKAIASGKLKASPRYERAITYRKKAVTHFHKNIVRKSEVAKRKFKALNPDLFYGDEVGVSYVGNLNKTVYLPLGPLSFADEVVQVNHPQLLTQEVNNVLGEPDVIETFDDATGIYSLGLGGTLTIRFTDNALVDVNGPDLYLFEIGQLEPTDLEISKDGKSWIKIGKIDGGVAEVDISSFVKPNELFYYVRFKDLKEKSGVPGADVDAIAAIGSAMRLNLDSQVLFDSGKSELKPEGINALKELVRNITVLKKGKVIVEGHTDDVGSESTNKALSLARAQSVSKALRQLIPSTQFKWQEKGYGESKPIVENDSDEHRSKNRRVEILVVPN
ncbi:OmpA family protein [Winogradskyella thalassocola]|uniref:OmpA family protein n=1 Tax=Winogradskyella thalassocola TaxID=262004 RepID=A0A1G8BKM2_9FLAO|nr:OmpA family protein [Winogradskyella thalassocola]SDH33767.1 OmpA family protein [Winogradskyella thalassocola]